jgi:O-antigen biosynthesis protein
LQYHDLSNFFTFDQYQRYSAIEKVIKILGSNRILEVGAAFSPLQQMVSSPKIVSVDQKFAPNLNLRCDALKVPFRDQSYELVVSTDVLEHISSEKRDAFLTEIMRVSSQYLILGFPHQSKLGVMADQLLSEFIQKVRGKSYEFLDEHAKFGLPEIEATRAALQSKMKEMVEIKNANIFSWLPLMMADFAIQDIPEFNEARILISDMFRRYYEKGSHEEPTYRTFFICSRHPIPTAIREQIQRANDYSPSNDFQQFANATLALAMAFRNALLERKFD